LTENKHNDPSQKAEKRRVYQRGYMRGRRADPVYRAAERIRDRERKRRLREAAKVKRTQLDQGAAQNAPGSTQPAKG